MALRGRRVDKFLELLCLVASGGLGIWVSSTSFQKSNIGWPQQPLTKKVLNFNMIFHDHTKKYFFLNIKIKLNSRTWMTLKSSVVIFQTLEPQQPQWPLQPQRPRGPQWPLQPHSIKKITNPDGWIIPGTKMTNHSELEWDFCVGFSWGVKYYSHIWFFHTTGLLRCQRPQKGKKRPKKILKALPKATDQI